MITILLKAELPILVVAGIVGRKVAAKLWTQVAGTPIPDTAQREVRVQQLLLAGILEGTLWQLSRMAIDRGLRLAVQRSEGVWIGKPGEGE
jgi:hypothetical protein